MKLRAFGNIGVDVSEVGLGCWQLGGADWGEMDEQSAFAILGAAVDAGVTFFDTADVYGIGKSETFIGNFLKRNKLNGKIFVATKLGRLPEPGWPENFTPATIRKHTEDSLRRLQVDCLDLTQFHCIPTEEFRKGEVFETLRELKKEGKIRFFGASVESMEEADLCLRQEGFTSLQIIFNIFRQKPISTLFDQAKARGVGIIVRLPLASGLLAGKYTKDTTFPAKDHRNYNRDGKFFNVGETFAGIPFAKAVELTDALKAFVSPGWEMADWALRWILDHDAVSTIIPGATKPEQITRNVKPSELPPLSAETHAKLREFYALNVAQYIRGPY